MEIGSKYYTIKLDINELKKFIPDTVWKKIEEKILDEAVTKIGIKFTEIDLIDKEGSFSFGVYT